MIDDGGFILVFQISEQIFRTLIESGNYKKRRN